MQISKKTLAGIVKNTEIANEVWKNYGSDPGFTKCFHLRPTSGGITVISTLPYAPMRGREVKTGQKLEALLSALVKKKETLLSTGADVDLAALLKEEGFSVKQTKTSAQDALEDSVQAYFIRGMLAGQSQYRGIQFVGSELTLERRNRFDVVGFKEDTLYIFELKKGRTAEASDQVKGYVDFIAEHKAQFMQVLGIYPSLNVPGFSDIKGICVMEYAYNASKSLVADAKEIGVDIWFYERALSFVSEL